MLQEKELNSTKARSAFFAIKDADQYNQNCMSMYTATQRSKAQTVLDLLDNAYSSKALYINYRKTFIAVKVENPTVRDRKLAREIDDIFEQNGYVKVKSAQGFIIRLIRKNFA
jgi:hypothetical protein